MSIKYICAVFRLAETTRDVSSLEVFTLVTMAEYANDQGVLWPSRSALASRLKMSLPWLRHVTAQLEARGWLEVSARVAENGRSTSNSYRLRLPVSAFNTYDPDMDLPPLPATGYAAAAAGDTAPSGPPSPARKTGTRGESKAAPDAPFSPGGRGNSVRGGRGNSVIPMRGNSVTPLNLRKKEAAITTASAYTHAQGEGYTQALVAGEARELAAPVVAGKGLLDQRPEDSYSATQDQSEELPTPESATQRTGDMTHSGNPPAALEIDIDPTDPTGARLSFAAPGNSRRPPPPSSVAPTSSPGSVRPQASPGTVDWDAAASALRGRRAESARFVAAVLREADANPTRRHWRAEITQRLVQRQEASPLHDPASYVAAVLQGWLKGEGHPPIPFEMSADAHRVNHDPDYWRYRVRMASDRVEALAARGDEDGAMLAQEQLEQAQECLRRAEARLGRAPAPAPATIPLEDLCQALAGMREIIASVEQQPVRQEVAL